MIPNPEQSTIIVSNTQTTVDEGISIIVHVKDDFGTSIPNQKIIFERVKGNLSIDSKEIITGEDGKAIFTVFSRESGNASFNIKADLGFDLPPIKLNANPILLNYTL